jgi:hypothetical protein
VVWSGSRSEVFRFSGLSTTSRARDPPSSELDSRRTLVAWRGCMWWSLSLCLTRSVSRLVSSPHLPHPSPRLLVAVVFRDSDDIEREYRAKRGSSILSPRYDRSAKRRWRCDTPTPVHADTTLFGLRTRTPSSAILADKHSTTPRTPSPRQTYISISRLRPAPSPSPVSQPTRIQTLPPCSRHSITAPTITSHRCLRRSGSLCARIQTRNRAGAILLEVLERASYCRHHPGLRGCSIPISHHTSRPQVLRLQSQVRQCRGQCRRQCQCRHSESGPRISPSQREYEPLRSAQVRLVAGGDRTPC